MPFEEVLNEALIQVSDENHFVRSPSSTDYFTEADVDVSLESPNVEDGEDLDGIKKAVHSNLCFLFGSMISTILSIMDMKSYHSDQDPPAGRDEGQGDDGYYYYNFYYNHGISIGLYTKLSVFSAILLCLNAYKDWNIAIETPSLRKKTTRVISSWNTDAFGAVCFGIAAMIDFLNAFPVLLKMDILSIKRDSTLEVFNASVSVASSHFYFFSALFAFGKIQPSCDDKSTTSYFVGDVLFLLGSTSDLITSYISDPVIIEANKGLLLDLWLMSSVLWLIDACLYLLGDYFWWIAENT